MIFLLRIRARSLFQGETVNFFFSKKKKLQKEVGERAARPLVWSGFCHESPVSSARTREAHCPLAESGGTLSDVTRFFGNSLLDAALPSARCLCPTSDSPNP